MSAVALLCELILQNGKVAAQDYREDVRYGALLDAGLIQSDGVVQSVLCDDCDAPHDAEIVFEDHSYGYHCPDLDFVPVERASLVAMRPNFANLMEQLCIAFECEPGSGMRLGPRTWRLGLVETPGGRVVVYFHPSLVTDNDLNELENALRTEIRRDFGLIVAAAGQLRYRENITRILTQMVRVDIETGNLRAIASVADAVNAPAKPTGGRPNLHRERLHLLLSERTEQGLARSGRNEEAEAVLVAYSARFPDIPPPHLSTVRAYVSKYRSG